MWQHGQIEREREREFQRAIEEGRKERRRNEDLQNIVLPSNPSKTYMHNNNNK